MLLRMPDGTQVDDPDYSAMTTAAVDFPVEQIIYREMIPTPPNVDHSTYRDIFYPRRYNQASFDQLIRRVAKEGWASRYRHKPEKSPLDIAVYKNSIIIIHLAPDPAYKFLEPAIVLKHDASGQRPDHLYGGLRYVDEEGNSHETAPDKCVMIYFFAKFVAGTPENPYIQSFLYNIDNLPMHFVPVDPDIRHPGNGGVDVEP